MIRPDVYSSTSAGHTSIPEPGPSPIPFASKEEPHGTVRFAFRSLVQRFKEFLAAASLRRLGEHFLVEELDVPEVEPHFAYG
jgi:hypothetical protein